MSSYQGYEFRVRTSQNKWPLPERDSDGFPYYRATVVIESEAAYKNLQDLVIIGEPVRSVYGFLYKFRVSAKKNPSTVVEGDLIVPIKKGTYGTFTAILVAFSPTTSPYTQNRFEADATWLITSEDITP